MRNNEAPKGADKVGHTAHFKKLKQYWISALCQEENSLMVTTSQF